MKNSTSTPDFVWESIEPKMEGNCTFVLKSNGEAETIEHSNVQFIFEHQTLECITFQYLDYKVLYEVGMKNLHITSVKDLPVINKDNWMQNVPEFEIHKCGIEVCDIFYVAINSINILTGKYMVEGGTLMGELCANMNKK